MHGPSSAPDCPDCGYLIACQCHGAVPSTPRGPYVKLGQRGVWLGPHDGGRCITSERNTDLRPCNCITCRVDRGFDP